MPLEGSWETIPRISGTIAAYSEVIESGGYRDAGRSLVTLKKGGQMDVVTKTYNESGLARLSRNCDKEELPDGTEKNPDFSANDLKCL